MANKEKKVVMEAKTTTVTEGTSKEIPNTPAPKTKIGRMVDNIGTDVQLFAGRAKDWFGRNKSKIIGAAGLLVGGAIGATVVHELNHKSDEVCDNCVEDDEPFELDEADITELESEDLDELSVEVPDEM